MPIRVICPGCHASFNVSDKFAGKSGPCPKCKAVMKIPEKSEEVVVHAPETEGPKDSTGKSVLKPIARQNDAKFSLPMTIGIVGTLITIPLVAFVLGRSMQDAEGNPDINPIILAVGAVLLAFPVVVSGYSFLRNDELEPYSGKELWLRASICAAVYAALWGLHWYLGWMNLYGNPMESFHYVIAVVVLLIPGALASLATLDLDGTSAAIHCGFYLMVTVGLRLIMGLGPL